MAQKPEGLARGNSNLDKDATLWHDREPAAQLVKRYSLSSEDASGGRSGQGLLLGVIFPCMANILGVLLFLRLPWIVGKAGVFNGFCLVFICCTCTFVTALSMGAIATNGRILGGGAYYLISRSLGPALGAGVGLCFYMANSIGAAMYFMGTVEAWEIARPQSQILTAGDVNNIRVTGFCILAVALIIVAGGVKLVAKLGTVFLFIVLGVIVCMYLGCLIGPGDDNTYSLDVKDVPTEGDTTKLQLAWSGPSGSYLSDNFKPDYGADQYAFPKDTTEHSFISLMALWFPAVTGIMAGSNRSSDLKDPAGDIPRGTLFAQGFTSIVYLSFVVLYGSVAPRASLLHDKFFAASAAWPIKEVVMYGVMASTIGAGLTSLVSGCRLLSAIAGDRTLPILSIFAARPGQEPRLALVASGCLCALAVAIGELNAVAPVLTMFFLMCYVCVNMSCAIMDLVHDPNWRPSFRFYHWSISVFGAILCIWMMFAISWFYAMVAILFCSCIFAYATHNSHQVKWGDGWQGMKFQLARNILTKMALTAHTKNWRPQLLVITQATIAESNAKVNEEVVSLHDPELLNLASQLKGGRGITILGGVCTTKGQDVFSDGGIFINPQQRERVLDGQEAMQRLLTRYRIEGFGRMVYTANFSAGLMSLVQIAGLGAFQPNCVVAAWPKDWQQRGAIGQDARAQLIRMVQVAVVFQKVMLISKGVPFPELHERLTGYVDIWWIVADGGILLLLSHLLMKHPVWQRCRGRLFAVADQVGDDPTQVKRELETYVKDFRLNIEVHVKVIDPNVEFELPKQRVCKKCGTICDETAKFCSECGASLLAPQAAPAPAPAVAAATAPQASAPAAVPAAAPAAAAPAEAAASSSAGDGEKDDSRAGKGKVVSLDDLIEGAIDFPIEFPKDKQPEDGGYERQVSDELPKKQNSTASIGSGIARWRSAGASASVAQNGSFPALIPGSIGRQAKAAAGIPESFGEATDAIPGNKSTGSFGSFGAGSFARQTSGQAGSRDDKFLQSQDQLSSTKPCSPEEMVLAVGLNRLMMQESGNSEIVITNLPDMPPGESAFGYFQLVNEMTKNLKRCFLVRGTASEVITAFT